MRTCHKCHQDLPESAFARDKAARDGLQVQCTRCIHPQNNCACGRLKDKRAAKCHLCHRSRLRVLVAQPLPAEKKCCTCKRTLSIDEFWGSTTRTTGIRPMCKDCSSPKDLCVCGKPKDVRSRTCRSCFLARGRS